MAAKDANNELAADVLHNLIHKRKDEEAKAVLENKSVSVQSQSMSELDDVTEEDEMPSFSESVNTDTDTNNNG